MVLEYIGVNDTFDGLKMYQEVSIGMFHAFCKLLRVSHSLKNHLILALGLEGHCCDILYWVMAGEAGCEVVAMCLLGRFLSNPVTVGSMGRVQCQIADVFIVTL